MNLEPCLDSLPFPIILHILSFNPRLKKIPKYYIIRKHLNKKYCKFCGEYIEIFHHKFYARHFHFKFQKLFRYSNQDLYKIVTANPLHFIFTIKNDISYETYTTFESVSFNIKLVYKKKHLNYFYNFQDVLKNEKDTLNTMVNLIDLNIFKNRDIYFIHDFSFLFPTFQLDFYQNLFLPSMNQHFSLEHQIIQILEFKYECFTYIYPIFYLDRFKKVLLDYLIQNKNKRIGFNLPLYFYFNLIEYNYLFIEYICFDIIQKCLKHYNIKFVSLLEKHIYYSFYITIKN
jgi:hypothetical protein